MDKKGFIVIIIIAVIIILALVGFIIWNSNNGNSGGNIKYVEDTGSGLFFEEGQDETQERGIAMPGWETMTIPANTKDVTVDFYNPETNKGYYHLTFELKLKNGETLYKSGLVKAGDHIRNITLSKGLERGTYDAVLHIQPYTADDKLTMKNSANVSFKLIVN